VAERKIEIDYGKFERRFSLGRLLEGSARLLE
jgi:hypothetical protein